MEQENPDKSEKGLKKQKKVPSKKQLTLDRAILAPERTLLAHSYVYYRVDRNVDGEFT